MTLVDRSLRQKYLPFLWNGNDSVQHWDFRSNKNIAGPIGIVPDDKGGFANDISMKQLFSFDNTKKTFGIGSLSLKNLLKMIPSVQIREYTSDINLDVILSLVVLIQKGFRDAKDIANKLPTVEQREAFQELLTYSMGNMTSSKIFNNLYEEFGNLMTQFDSKTYDLSKFKGKDGYNSQVIVNFCYGMYYRLVTTQTSNVYTLPFNSNHIMKGNGENGYSSTIFGLESGGKDNLIGMLMTFIAPTVNITLMPMWQGLKGGNSVMIEMTINLFNDTISHAIANYIFVNTIMPQNLPTQYGIFAQPPSLYDLRIQGGNRLFMCSGDFQCTYKGVMRNINSAMKAKFKKHCNKNCGVDIDKVIEGDMIKIPDVYELKLTFKSLLPNVFNNFLFQFALNNKMDNYEDNGGYLTGAMNGSTIVKKIKDSITTMAGNVDTYIMDRYDAETEWINSYIEATTEQEMDDADDKYKEDIKKAKEKATK